MIFPLIFALATITVNADPANQYDFRRSRQLDLGLQDINYSSEKTPTPPETLDSLTGGYLPPVSPQKAEGAQSRQSFDVKTPNDFLGFFKNEPSKDLLPPFNDLEREVKIKPTSNRETAKSSSKGVKLTIVSSSTPSTTQNQPTETFVSSKAEATNELRSYLPPQESFSEAAQTSVQVVQPAPQENDDHDHHHGHHDHHHGDICADAFHSFLCAPLKARKRITGALPNSLRGQSSFVQYQKVLPDKDPAPSNTFQNEYLPPSPPSPPFRSASNVIQSTYSPPQTTQRRISPTTTITPRSYSPPKVAPESSNANERFYLPPLTEPKGFPFVSPASSIQVNNKVPGSPTNPTPPTLATPIISYQPIKVKSFRPVVVTEKPKPVFTTKKTVVPTFLYSQANTVLPTFKPQPSNEDRSYLPPNPDSSFVSLATVRLTTPPPPKISTFAPAQANTVYISPLPKLQPKIISTTVTPQVSFLSRSSTPVLIVSTSEQPRPTFVAQQSVSGSSYFPPKFQSASNLISTTIKPTTTKKPLPVYSLQPSAEDRSYLPPDPNVQPAAAQINAEAVAAPQTKNPFHHGRDLCTDPFHSFLCVGPKPRRRITGALPSGFRSESSNTNELIVKPAAIFQNENRIKVDKPLETSPTQNVGYNYPVPSNPLPSTVIPSTATAPTTGYSYPKPEKIFPLPSQPKQVVAKSTPKSAPPAVLRTSEARTVTGYDYPKPEKPLALPAEPSIISTTSTSPTAGYSYPKPQKPLPLPTEQKEVVSAPAEQPKGYQYPKPKQNFDLPEKKGYSYPKPGKRLELPSEARSTFLLPRANPKLNVLGNLGSAEFIPVNKLDKREEPRENQKFGERLKKRGRRTF